jgi:hypothetical protein
MRLFCLRKLNSQRPPARHRRSATAWRLDAPRRYGRTALPGGKFAFGVQYRVVYDGSNLPGPAGSTFDDASYVYWNHQPHHY